MMVMGNKRRSSVISKQVLRNQLIVEVPKPPKRKLDMIMHRHTDGCLHLWACRGEGKGCKRNTFRNAKKPCDDCFGPLPPTMTVEQVWERINQGDA